MIYSDNTYDITNNIATYTRRDFKSVFDTTSNKWYMLNNLDNYEEYGIYGDSFDTYYQGKLVIVNDHEYEWDGTEWDDLGEYIEVKYPYILFPNSTSFSNSAYFETITPLKNTYTLEIKLKTPANNGSRWRLVIGNYNNWGSFSTNMFALYTNQNNNNFGMNWWNYGQSRLSNDTAFAMAANTEYIIKIQVGTGETYINGVLQTNRGGNNVNGTLSTNMRIASGYTLDPGFNGQIYYVKVTEGNELIAYYEANNDDNTLGYYESVSETKITKSGSGSITYGEDRESVRPKDYPEKTAPTISTLWASTIYKNSAHLTTLMRNDVEMIKMDYMSDDILKKGDVPTPTPVGPANDELWYTSSDGNIVTPFRTSSLPTIVSNTYSDGKGIIKFASDITSIGDYAFNSRTGLTSVTIPDSVTSTGYVSFYNCGLTAVTIGSGVTTIGESTFFNCTGLTYIEYTGTIAQWNTVTKVVCWNRNVPATVVHCTDGDTAI